MLRQITVLLLALTVIACKKDKQPVPKDDIPVDQPGHPTPVGTVTGNATTKVIGAAGGFLASEDGLVLVKIPPGALTSAQTISVTPITGEAPGAVTKGYRITPHNLQLATPATITFFYNQEELNGSTDDMLGIAYQKADGIWMSIDQRFLNKVDKTLSIQTNHFSDWIMFHKLFIEPRAGAVVPGGEVELRVRYQVNKVNSTNGEQPIIYGYDIPKKVTKRWRLAGDGSLISRADKAYYHAPMEVPEDNPVAVSAEIDYGQSAQLLLVCNITIMQDGFIVNVGGGPGAGSYRLGGPSGGVYRQNTQSTQLFGYGINTGDVTQHIELTFPGKGDGSPYAWSREQNINFTLQVKRNGVITVYEAVWADNVRWHNSPGSIVIDKYGNKGQYISGSFNVSKAGYENGLKTTTNVTGSFMVLYTGESSN